MDSQQLQQIKMRYNIVGNCEALNHALNVALQVAPTDLSVLIVGESGVGKEIIPRLIHDNSPRRREKYFAINCGSIPEGTIDSELFGHEKGSFTGAIGESNGYFGTANRGTIFLDEVGELPLATQARLLRVLETGEYIRVGGQEILRTDVRIVAATNVNMRKAVSQGRFREDLFYRLNTIPIQIPPLRDRGGDILLLFRLFSMQMAEKYHLPKITLAGEAKDLLMSYKWPGNVRQLKNITEQMSVLSQRREIDSATLLQFIPRDEESYALAPLGPQGKASYESEREILYKILYELRGNVSDLRRELNSLRTQMNERGAMTQQESKQINLMPIDAEAEELKEWKRPADPIGDPEMPMLTADRGERRAKEAERPYGQARTAVPFGQNDTAVRPERPDESLDEDRLKRESLEKALRRCGGNRAEAAKMLGISSRTLYRRLKRYGLD